MTDHERLCELLEDVASGRKRLSRIEAAAWRARLRSDGPDGLRVVPVDPTGAMRDAATLDWYHNHGPESRTLHGENIDGIYKAMLRAGGERAD